ncbi:MAG: hypothetical protein LAT57_06010 [Balneolales bacterium]|nr:hypothetical protein [Balneolales bacterium]
MKKYIQSLIFIPIVAIALLAGPQQTQAQTSNGDFGLGVILGEPTGVSAKLFLGESRAFDFGAAWSFGNNSSMHLHADYLIHRFDLIQVESGRLPLYYGIGTRLRLADDAQLGIRIPIGFSYYFENDPIELFFEIVPILDLAPKTSFSGNSGIGIRYYFGKAR